MNKIVQTEREAQDRVIALFRNELGYRYLGDWHDRDDNSNIEETLLTAYLEGRGYSSPQISKVLDRLRAEADHPNRDLYENNRAVYELLRYGVPVKLAAGLKTETIQLIDWQHPERNDFAIAEEVTLKGKLERRPDLVLYVNGIALAVLELKSGCVSIGDGIRQLISNQRSEFNAWFFSTVQFVFAGNNSEGLRYGTVGTSEKYFLKWKEDEKDNSRFPLDKYLLKLCAKERLLELIYDFVLFDGGIKKVPRPHQYVGVKKAQKHANDHEGGIIWHTQGSGKSIVMVLLAKWILENKPNARVLIVTDRDELDKQIESVFLGAGEKISRASSGLELLRRLSQPTPRLLCALVHKFGKKGSDNFDVFIKELRAQPSQTFGEVFVFVDECHRTQSGRLHSAMKARMPNAVLIGFTGTPLLKADKQTSLEVFGKYIDTYLYKEAVEDGVILDLVYEARDIDQRLGSPQRVDSWFAAKTSGLNDWQKAALREKWGTMQNVLSSYSRMEQVVNEIVLDFNVKPRLLSRHGNAMLVASSIYEACRYYVLFQRTELKEGRCALITSYSPHTKDITKEDTGANTETDKQFIYETYNELLKGTTAAPGKSRTETYEDQAKQLFKEKPATMRLLIVVDKLLTGFDAPSCTYLYIDKNMQDHGLFQAICRTNRIDGEDKDFGYIVDFKNLLTKVENAIAVYTSELDPSPDGTDPQILLQDRLVKNRERLDGALEQLAFLCESVETPGGDKQYIQYFCGNPDLEDDLQEREPQRLALYKTTATLLRAYGNIADDLERAGYNEADSQRLRRSVDQYTKLRDLIRLASGESIDLKAYEADMRYLIDSFIQADEPRKISPFDETPLLELIAREGIAKAIESRLKNLKHNPEAVAETIENNVRSLILKEGASDPAYYDRMSELLKEIIAERRDRALEYEEYLKRIAELVQRVTTGQGEGVPEQLNTPGRRALYNNLGEDEALALKIDETVKRMRPDDWRGNRVKENVIKYALHEVLQDEAEVERIFLTIRQQPEY
ncbi:type I restriction endonuclease subunit R [Gloeobacter morelensis]|uniref:Type I restriction enzyme endonuclease subunit n=1 Tax=Gloeobacter morelensis MG652769 TaxID=2781736 RepID=A0ABY3PN37_9CYAN|nr:HsdR family type I site-specific deoxyribonuclease [Gloeobacter morelensis]UFP95117.1 HsdR family type I site-specific deoxyribonuclease [Gloeobacter morelensis MG652769]